MSTESTSQDENLDLEKTFIKLKTWIEDSLDMFKNDLLPLLYPVFIHIYLDLIIQDSIDEAKVFFEKYKKEFPEKYQELKAFESVNSAQHIHENSYILGFRQQKYHLLMSKYAYNLLVHFLEEKDMLYILRLMNQHMHIKALSGPRPEEERTGIDAYVEEVSVDLATNLVSQEAEDAILASEQYRYDHLETYVQQLKKQRESKREFSIRPTPSQVEAEIEKLKDLCKRVTINKSYLPSICCYTVFNTYEGMTCAEISPDSTMMACGFKDSFIDVHSLTKESLGRLKSSSELAKIDLKSKESKFEEIGSVHRLIGHSGPVFAIKFNSSNKFLISASQDCTIRLWSLDLFKCVAVYKAHVFPIWCLDFAPNDFYFASGGADRQAIIWSTKSTKPERLVISALGDVTALKFHPNSKYLFIGSSDHKIRMHSVEDASMTRSFVGHNDVVTCIDVSYCGKLMVSGSKDKTVILWDVESARQISKYTGHESVIYSVSFSWLGTVICSCGADNSVRLWDKTDVKGGCLGVYHTKSTPVIAGRFGYRNIISCTGPYLGG